MFRLYPLPDDPAEPLPPRVLSHLPPSAPVDCIVRIYVIRAFDLVPADENGLVSSYHVLLTHFSSMFLKITTLIQGFDAMLANRPLLVLTFWHPGAQPWAPGYAKVKN